MGVARARKVIFYKKFTLRELKLGVARATPGSHVGPSMIISCDLQNNQFVIIHLFSSKVTKSTQIHGVFRHMHCFTFSHPKTHTKRYLDKINDCFQDPFPTY